MISDAQVVVVHSVAEAYLYLMLSRCGVCGKGPLRSRRDLTRTGSAPGGWLLEALCPACDNEPALHFTIEPEPTREQAVSDRINQTPSRSQAIDLLGWLTLFQTILAESQKQRNKQAARQLACEAAQCLDEALRFYDGDNELPGEDAFFAEASRQRFHDHPQQFARSKWRQRRLMLPDATVRTKPTGVRWRWWQFWKRRDG